MALCETAPSATATALPDRMLPVGVVWAADGDAVREAGIAGLQVLLSGPLALVALGVIENGGSPSPRTAFAAACRTAGHVRAFVPVAPRPHSTTSLLTWLARDAEILDSSLHRLENAVEIVVTARRTMRSEPEVAPAGRPYLRAVAERRAAHAALEDAARAEIRRWAEPWPDRARASAVQTFATRAADGQFWIGADLALLIDRPQADFVLSALSLQIARRDAAVCSGPWPAYRFARSADAKTPTEPTP